MGRDDRAGRDAGPLQDHARLARVPGGGPRADRRLDLVLVRLAAGKRRQSAVCRQVVALDRAGQRLPGPVAVHRDREPGFAADARNDATGRHVGAPRAGARSACAGAGLGDDGVGGELEQALDLADLDLPRAQPLAGVEADHRGGRGVEAGDGITVGDVLLAGVQSSRPLTNGMPDACSTVEP